jgi:hypothetical protein
MTTQPTIEATEATYYTVGITGKWTNEAAPESFFTDRGGSVADSRIESEFQAGIKTLWIGGYNVAKLFPTQQAQISYLREKGLL